MNRIKILLVAVILAVGILFPTATLASSGTTVSITDATLPTGATGSVVLSISGVTEPVSCADINVSYDPAVVEVTGVSGSDFNSLVDNVQNNLGHTHLVAYVTSQTGLTGTIKVADITLKRLGGESALTLDVITLKGDDGNSIPFTVVNGRVAAAALAGTTVSITDVTLSTGATGSVALSISGVTEPVSCIDVDVSYSSAVVEVLDTTGSSFDSLVNNIQNSDGHTHLVAYVTSETGLTGTIKVADITLKRLGGESALTLNVITLKGDDGNPIPFTVVNGQVAAAAPPAPPPVGNGGGPPTYYTETNLFGTVKSYRISRTGEILKAFEATSPDGMLTIAIPKGTIALDKDGKRLKGLQAAVDESPSDPPKDTHIIGLAYDFGPIGATFNPALTLTWSYDPEALPEGVAEEDLVLAYYDEEAGEWVEIECVVDTENNVITASVSHFTTFAVIGAVTPPSPPEPEPGLAIFSLSNLRIEPAEVEVDEVVTLTVSVANTGGSEGSYTVVLKINEVVVEKKTVTVAAGSSEIIPFSVTREEAGSYSVTVDGLSASFTVIAPAPPLPPEEEEIVPPEEEEIVPPAPTPVKPNWPLIGGIIGGCVLVGLLVFFLVRRRAY